MTQDTHFKIVRKTGNSKNRKQHTIRCESIHLEVDDCQLTVLRTAGVRRELRDQFIAGHNGKPLWSTRAFVRSVRKIEHHDVFNSAIFAHQFGDKRPREWT